MILKLIFALLFGYNGDTISIQMPGKFNPDYILTENHTDSLPGDECERMVNFLDGYHYPPQYFKKCKISKLEAFLWCMLFEYKMERDRIKNEYQRPI